MIYGEDYTEFGSRIIKHGTLGALMSPGKKQKEFCDKRRPFSPKAVSGCIRRIYILAFIKPKYLKMSIWRRAFSYTFLYDMNKTEKLCLLLLPREFHLYAESLSVSP